MGAIWKPQSMEVLKSWIDAIIDEASDELTSWEEKFVEDMQHRVSRGQPLTEYQEKKLEEIYAEKTS